MNRATPLTAGLSYGILSGLDPEQRKAAEILAGQVIINAGPGSGKTRTITHRIAHLVASKTARPEQCIGLFFSQRACDEVSARLKKMLGKTAARIPILTFHSFGHRVIEERRAALKLPRGFRLADRKERGEFAAKALQWPYERALSAIDGLIILKRKASAIEPRSDEGVLNTLFEEWRDHEGWLDEEDLLELPLRLFDGHSEFAELYRKQFRFVSVDDYQDVDALSYRLIRHLVQADGNLCVCGDADQSICGFRGADSRYFLQFEKDFPFAHKVSLVRNYRSGEAIVEAAFSLMKSSALPRAPKMTSLMEGRGQIEVCQAGTDRAEIELIVQRIEKMVSGAGGLNNDIENAEMNERQISFSDIAVLYRTEEQSVLFIEAFERAGFPFQRLDVEPQASIPDGQGAAVSLLTLQAAKGLEFRVVFIAGCEDGLIPLTGDEAVSESDPDEEQRLFYVGMTRAKDCLILTHAAKRLRHGGMLDQKASPFLKQIKMGPPLRAKPSELTPLKNAPISQLDLF